jgi:phosphate/sulfate permease
MPYAWIAGPLVALIGAAAVIFVMRHKSVEKKSMYSSKRQQIEHKVRAARQRTLTPHGHEEKPAGAATTVAPSPFQPTAAAPTFTYEPSAYAPPPAAPAPITPPPSMPPPSAPPPEFMPAAGQEHSPWDVGPAAPPPPPTTFDIPPAAAEPSYAAAPPSAEPAWTPAPAPAEPLPPAEREPVLTTTPAGGGASWSIVGEAKEAMTEPPKAKKKEKKGAQGAAWSLASGEAPGDEAGEEVRSPNSALAMAIAQYAVFVVGLVMVLIGVLVMVANTHST